MIGSRVECLRPNRPRRTTSSVNDRPGVGQGLMRAQTGCHLPCPAWSAPEPMVGRTTRLTSPGATRPYWSAIRCSRPLCELSGAPIGGQSMD
jgi:hypothetical protein